MLVMLPLNQTPPPPAVSVLESNSLSLYDLEAVECRRSCIDYYSLLPTLFFSASHTHTFSCFGGTSVCVAIWPPRPLHRWAYATEGGSELRNTERDASPFCKKETCQEPLICVYHIFCFLRLKKMRLFHLCCVVPGGERGEILPSERGFRSAGGRRVEATALARDKDALGKMNCCILAGVQGVTKIGGRFRTYTSLVL